MLSELYDTILHDAATIEIGVVVHYKVSHHNFYHFFTSWYFEQPGQFFHTKLEAH